MLENNAKFLSELVWGASSSQSGWKPSVCIVTVWPDGESFWKCQAWKLETQFKLPLHASPRPKLEENQILRGCTERMGYLLERDQFLPLKKKLTMFICWYYSICQEICYKNYFSRTNQQIFFWEKILGKLW